MRKIRTNLLTPVDRDTARFLKDHVIAFTDDSISFIRPHEPSEDRDCENRLDCVALPGLIDIHTHLSQYRIRGRYEPSLLKWLDKHVFPAEALSADPDYASGLADEFFEALFKQGTTMSVIYTAPFTQACEAAFASAVSKGARAMIGMTLMDRNSPSALSQSTAYALENSIAMHEKYSGSSTLLSYIFTPRFALSCSSELMHGVGEYARNNGAWLQTHLSENPEEIAQVRRIFGGESYTKVYEDLGLLGPRSIFAHAIHLSDEEIATLARHDCRIAHCPDSNFFLKSGEFDYARMDEAGLKIGLGSDVAAGTSLNMLYHAKMANYRQSALSMSPARLFYHLTLGNARLLDMGQTIGSLEAGKQADLVLFDATGLPNNADELVSALCFSDHESRVRETVIAGRSVYRV